MAAQAKAVNVIYHEVRLVEAATFDAGDEGGFVHTEEPLPVGSKVTVELLEEAEGDPAGRVVARVDRVKEKSGKKVKPGMVLRFLDEAAEEAPKPKKKRKKKKKKAEAEAEVAPDAEPAQTELPETGEEPATDEAPVEEPAAEEPAAEEAPAEEPVAEEAPAEEPAAEEAPAEEPAAEEAPADDDQPKKKKRKRRKKKK